MSRSMTRWLAGFFKGHKAPAFVQAPSGQRSKRAGTRKGGIGSAWFDQQPPDVKARILARRTKIRQEQKLARRRQREAR